MLEWPPFGGDVLSHSLSPMEQLLALDELQQLLAEDEAVRPRREVYLKVNPARWKIWAQPKFENVTWFYRELDDARLANLVWKNPHLYFSEDIVIERLTNPRGRTSRLQQAFAALYGRKYRAGPGPLFDAAVFGLVMVLGAAHLVG